MKDNNKINWWAILFVVCFIILLLYGCKTQSKAISETKTNNSEQVSNDIVTMQNKALETAIQNAFEKVIFEQLNINRIDRNYDTSKPTDSVTGKPPLLSESETKISKQTESKQVDNGKVEQKESASDSTVDKSKMKTTTNETNKSTSESNKVNELNIYLKWTGIIALIVIFGFIAYKLFFKRNGVL